MQNATLNLTAMTTVATYPWAGAARYVRNGRSKNPTPTPVPQSNIQSLDSAITTIAVIRMVNRLAHGALQMMKNNGGSIALYLDQELHATRTVR